MGARNATRFDNVRENGNTSLARFQRTTAELLQRRNPTAQSEYSSASQPQLATLVRFLHFSF